MTRLPIFTAILGPLLATVAVAQTVSDDVPVTFDVRSDAAAPLEQDVVATMRTFVDARIVPGVTVVVTDPSRTLLHTSIGYRDLEAGVALEPDAMFWLASITKTMTATAFMTLVDEGRVDLNDPVGKYLPELADMKLADGSTTLVTVRHCLTHTSGLSVAQDKRFRLRSPKEVVEHMSARPLDFEPGSAWKYSMSLDVIARISEVVSGQSYQEFVQTRLFDPVGMTDTTFNLTAEQAARAMLPYQLETETGGCVPADFEKVPHVTWDLEQTNWGAPSWGAFSTGKDLAKYARMMLGGGTVGEKRVLSQRAVEAMTSVHTGELKTGWTPGNGWGLGWCVVRYPQHVTRSLSPGSFGHGGVYGPQLWIDPQQGVAYILLFERKDIKNSDGSDLREAFQVSAARALTKEATGE